jgi:putative ABC transport system permease protein
VDLGVTGIKRGGAGEHTTASPDTVETALRAQSGTARYVGVRDVAVALVGYHEPINIEAYSGDSSWLGYQVVTGRWYAGPDEVVADSPLLRTTGHHVGDTVTLSTDQGRRQVRVVGEVFDLDHEGMVVHGDAGILAALAPTVPIGQFQVALRPGTSVPAYVSALSSTLGTEADVSARGDQERGRTLAVMISLAVTLAALLSAVAALGVFNTVVLNTRERIHEIGVLKTLGMTPRQVRATVVASVAGVGLVAGVVATPLGDLLHHRVLPVMGNSAGTGIPASFIDVYRPVELVVLALAGVVLAVLGALVPAGWAAATRIATALRAE